MPKSLNEDVPTSYPLNDRHLTELRKELEGKIEKQSQRIDKTVPQWVFNFVISGLTIIFIAVISYAFSQVNDLNNKINTINNRITAIETKLNSHNIR